MAIVDVTAELESLLREGKRKRRAIRNRRRATQREKVTSASGERLVPKGISIGEYDSKDDWILTMILMAVMYANPSAKLQDVIAASKDWARKMGMPNSDHLWRKQRSRIEHRGVRAEASRIRRELYSLL